MTTYRISVISKTIYVQADSERQAEEKYDAYWFEEACPCGAPAIGSGDCNCVEVSEEVEHITEEVK